MDAVLALKKYVRTKAETSLFFRKILVSYREGIYRSGQKGVITKVPLGILNTELTNKCPMKCVMCARTNNMTRSQGLMEFSTFKKVIDEYVAVNPERASTKDFWLHGFGESMTHPDIGKFIRYAVSKNVKAGVSLNPIMLSPDLSQDLLTSGIKTIVLALDGHDNESFERIRGLKNAYEQSKERCLAFLEMKVKLGAQTKIILNMIDFEKNRPSIEKMAKFWSSVEGVDLFRRKFFSTWDGTAPDVTKLADMSCDNESLRKVYSVVGCHNPWQQMTVTWDGDVVPCCYDYDKKYVLGNIKNQTLAEMWNGPRMQALREEFLSNNVQNPLCRNCSVLYPPIYHKTDTSMID